VWLGDSIGEMATYFSCAKVALLGGSFEPLGGQNLIEAAACGCPVLMGPHTYNFADAAALAQHEGAAMRVDDIEAAVRVAVEMLATSGRDERSSPIPTDPLYPSAYRALAFANRHRGAAERMAQQINALIVSAATPS
jgi:3-deoxy-D-manno-octulosonic-acid transferase